MTGARWTPGRRIALACVGALCLGALLPGLLDSTREWLRAQFTVCASGLPAADLLCDVGRGSSPVLPAVLLVGAALPAWFAARLVARWCLRPVRALAGPLSHVGPQNLGHRIRPTGGDELADLSRAIDDMMERIAAGYDGQRRFAANASHELRTPLAVQRTLIEVGMSQPLDGSQGELLTRQLLDTNERNERLIEGLLALSEADQGLVSRTPQRLDRIAEEVVAAHQERAAEAGVEISTELDPRHVLGEAVMLERLVTNLVQNAIKYNRRGGTVLVRVGGEPALLVANTGQRVPAEAVGSLFEPFRRLRGDRVDHSGGAGLGLTIARSITQAHDGTIAAAPRGDDGLEVTVDFPAAD
jgi:signal transduction histidine kinase